MWKDELNQLYETSLYLQIDFSPTILCKAYREQFQQKQKRKKTLMNEIDCVIQKLNEYLEYATCHFQHQGGGRWQGKHYD